MAVADTINSIKENLTNAYTAIEEKGGTIPEHKNVANLAEAIQSITASGGETYETNSFGAIKYLDANNEEQVYIAKSFEELALNKSTQSAVVITLEDGTAIRNSQIIGYSFGKEAPTALPDYFLGYCQKLVEVLNLDTTFITTIGNYFMQYCTVFNQDLVFPSTLTTIGMSFLYNLNQMVGVVDLSNTAITEIPMRFFQTSQSVASSAGCASVLLPPNLTSIGYGFLYGNKNFDAPLTLPNTLTTIAGSFMYSASSFKQPLAIPASVQSIGSDFMGYANLFTGPLTINTTATPPTGNVLVTNGVDYPIYAQGVTVAGPGASLWRTSLPNSSTSPYRNLHT